MKRNRTKVWESLVLETPEPKVTQEELWQKTGGVTDEHLLNIYHLLEKKMEDDDILDHIGDADPMDWYD